MRKLFFALALMAGLGFSSLFIETTSAQNPNTTMNANMHSTMSGHRRHRKHRRHRRHKMKHNMKMAPKNANQ